MATVNMSCSMYTMKHVECMLCHVECMSCHVVSKYDNCTVLLGCDDVNFELSYNSMGILTLLLFANFMTA